MTSARDAHLRHVAAIPDEELTSHLRDDQDIASDWPYTTAMWSRPPTHTPEDDAE